MMQSRMRTLGAAAALLLGVVLTGCAGSAAEDAPAAEAPPSTAPEAETAEDDGGDGDSGDGDGAGGVSGECAEAPDENVDGDYPAANLPAVQERTSELVGYFEAVDGRYCIDSAGDITYFLIYDFAEDGFHTLDVCGSVFTYFEGDFEGAAVVYTDGTVRCG